MAELLGLLSAQARQGNVRAIELLLRVTPAEVEPAEPLSPMAEVDELGERRQVRSERVWTGVT